uniref:Uncharacterized protein n=1 Tax=Anguilla anguilla TaxID=7936 RepID=A0A0E9Q0U7_ANGAN
MNKTKASSSHSFIKVQGTLPENSNNQIAQ